MTSLISISSIIGPLLMTGVFYYFTKDDAPFYFPGAPFFVGGILFILGFVLAVITLNKMKEVK